MRRPASSAYYLIVEILRTLKLYADQKGMPFVVIGGHAVNAHGIQRQTGDLDLLVRSTQSELWHTLLTEARYEAGQRDGRFARYRFGAMTSWPIDLMFVDDKTFYAILDAAIDVDFGIATAKVASALHLLALKIHALKFDQAHRRGKDLADVFGLLSLRPEIVTPQQLKELCDRYGSKDLYERLKNR